MYLHGYEYGKRTLGRQTVRVGMVGTDLVSRPLMVFRMSTSSVEPGGFVTRLLIT